VNALVDSTRKSPAGSDNDETSPLLEDRSGHLAVKNLILTDAAASGDEDVGADSFSSELFERFSHDGRNAILDMATSNRGAFVAAALCKVPSVRSAALAQVKANRKRLADLSEGSGATAGYTALLNELASQS
jgi:hypothetical protein